MKAMEPWSGVGIKVISQRRIGKLGTKYGHSFLDDEGSLIISFEKKSNWIRLITNYPVKITLWILVGHKTVCLYSKEGGKISLTYQEYERFLKEILDKNVNHNQIVSYNACYMILKDVFYMRKWGEADLVSTELLNLNYLNLLLKWR